jgi:peptidase A4-like protein
MKSLRFAPAAALAAVSILAFTLAIPALADPPPHGHAPIQPHRNPDGSLTHGPQFLAGSLNWAGYEIAHFQTGQKYTSARASWIVAPITFGPTLSQGSDEYAATWVGIGGFCTDPGCNGIDPTLIQLGTQSEVAPDGTATYSAWYEALPQAPVTIPLAIHAGDQVTASLQCAALCIGQKQAWFLTMTNLNTNQSWSHPVAYSSSQLSVEWIEEAPVMGGILPLANFDVATVAGASANGGTPVLSFLDNAIVMIDPWGQFVNVSAPDGNNNFAACYGFGPFQLLPCP